MSGAETDREVAAQLRARFLLRLRRRIDGFCGPGDPYVDVSEDGQPQSIDLRLVRDLAVIDARCGGFVARQDPFRPLLRCRAYRASRDASVGIASRDSDVAIVLMRPPRRMVVIRVDEPARFTVDPWSVFESAPPSGPADGEQWWKAIEELHAFALAVLDGREEAIAPDSAFHDVVPPAPQLVRVDRGDYGEACGDWDDPYIAEMLGFMNTALPVMLADLEAGRPLEEIAEELDARYPDDSASAGG